MNYLEQRSCVPLPSTPPAIGKNALVPGTSRRDVLGDARRGGGGAPPASAANRAGSAGGPPQPASRLRPHGDVPHRVQRGGGGGHNRELPQPRYCARICAAPYNLLNLLVVET